MYQSIIINKQNHNILLQTKIDFFKYNLKINILHIYFIAEKAIKWVND